MSQEPKADLCTSILRNVRSTVSPECYRAWFKDLSIVHVQPDALHFAASNRYVKHWIESHYRKELLSAATAVMPDVRSVEITVARAESAVRNSVAVAKALDNALPAQLRDGSRAGPDALPSVRSGLFPPVSFNFRLETLVVGRCNRIACAAAQTICESPGSVYNPLFINGPHGLGKTHLLQGIGQSLQERSPGLNIVYVSCEEFTNGYISAVQNKRLDVFRARYRSCDALLVDDVQFFSGREKTQEEFLHTFDALRHAGKQIVLCANCSPREIRRLDQRLVTRFQSGLVARLDGPEPDVRMEVLRAKAKTRGLQLADDVAGILSAHIHSNVRELEGAVCKLMALAAADCRAPDRELAVLALRELGYLRSGPLTLADVLAAVSQRYSVGADEIRGDKRHAALVRVRHIAMYLSTQLCSNSVADIGRFYGNRDHATVLHAVKKMNELVRRDEELKSELQSLRQVLGR